MDISKIDHNYIELFDSSYTVVRDVFEVEPTEASAKTKKRIRKWVEKTDIAGKAFPAKVMKHISREVSDDAFIVFLKACHDHVQLNGTHQKQLFDKFSQALPEDVKSALWALFEHGAYGSSFRKVGADAQIDVEYGAGYTRTLTLISASCVPEDSNAYFSFENSSLVKQDSEYVLTGEAENWESDTCTPFAVRFTDANVSISVTRADAQTFCNTPWQHLQSIASVILDKHFLPGEHFNDREKKLFPLLVEISKLSYWARIPQEYENAGFSQLKTYINKWGYSELLPLFEKLEKQYANPRQKDRLVDKITAKLNKQKYVPLWRELYTLLTQSQETYPAKAHLAFPAELLKKTRNEIQKLMETQGYAGVYPNFLKCGAIDGIRLAESYGKSYFVGFEKNAVYHIHCTEEFFNEHLMIEFLCGTELLRKNEAPGDIYSCLFNARGRRFSQSVSYEDGYPDKNENITSDDLAFRVKIAAKKAELRSLTKQERKELVGFDIPWWKLFVLVFVVMGGLFGIFMTLGLMLLGALTCLVVGQARMIPSMLTDFPWWAFLLFTWGALDGIMVAITVLAKRK